MSTVSVPISDTEVTPDPGFREKIPRDFARLHLILGARAEKGTRCLLAASSTPPAVIWNVGAVLPGWDNIVYTEAESLARRIDVAYAEPDRREAETLAVPGDREDIDALLAEADRDLLSTEGKGPVIKLADALLFEALGRSASDVHIQPTAEATIVRYRVDGVLQTARELSPSCGQPLTNRIKVMGGMDIAERRLPQDGRATVTIGRGGSARRADLRISTLPMRHGERTVVRILDAERGTAMTTFRALGMPEDVESGYLERASRTSGIMLITGPTGSGKTTTLYTTLRWITERPGADAGSLNVMTIEDPIEYELSTAGVAISQAQVNTKKGITFATGLRHILRQDPDVVMVGEIRDEETARIAIQSSLTGHLVFSTLHTNDAASAVVRLADLGIERYLINASLSGILAQRLLRKVHRDCNGKGCAVCGGTGLHGRVGVYELLVLSDEIRGLIGQGATAWKIRQTARAKGMRNLCDEGDRLVGSGITTRAEAGRVLWGLGPEDPFFDRGAS